MFIPAIRSKAFIAVGLLATALLSVHPCRMLVADYYFGRAAVVLDERATDERDITAISAETMPAYRTAVHSVQQAAAWDPANARYVRALADMFLRIGRWEDAMSMLNEQLPEDARSAEEDYKEAKAMLTNAIQHDPLNADYHLAMGQLEAGNAGNARAWQELQLAIEAAPMNALLRYAVAMQYLNGGKKDKALEQARILAAIDESYVAFGSAQKTQVERMRNPWYEARLTGSYLFKSLEIAWRASDKNVGTITAMVPANPEAQEAVRLFFEWKGME